MYKDLLNQLIDKYGTTNANLNDFLDLLGAYYLFRRDEWENPKEEEKERITPTLSDIKKELALIQQLKDENNQDLLDYIKEQSIAYIVGIESLFYQFNIDIWYFIIEKSEFLLDSWYKSIWYYGYYQERNKPLSDDLLEFLNGIDKVTLTEQDVEDNANLPINKKTRFCYILAKNIYKVRRNNEILDLIKNKDDLLNSRVLTNLTLETDLDKMLELARRLKNYYFDTSDLLEAIANILNYDIERILDKHNIQPFKDEDIKELVEDLKKYFLENEDKKDTSSEEEKTPKKKRLSAKELKEKYKNITLLDDDTKLDYNRKWARIDTSKVNTNIMDLRENITKKLENNTDITLKSIKEIEQKAKPSKEDLEKLKDLKETLKEQQEQRKKIQEDISELKDDIDLINKQISDTTEATQIKSLTRRLKQLKKQLQEKEQIINNGGVTMQMDLFTGKYTYEKQNKRKKEAYKLMINADYDIQNFNSEGRNFLYYVPNIPNIIENLNEDFINIDIDDYLEFTGRPNGNVSRIRRNLQNTLKEMRKESYDYSFIDERGALQEGSLVLIGDIKGTEYKGKASVKVQLGATFKDNLKQVFIKNQYAKVNKDVFKLGQGKNNKAENMAKEIFIYLSRLCRIEAKKGTINGQWRKDIHLDLLITHLAEINLLNYNPNTYNKSVKEPLLNALNTGVELGLFNYKTNAFKYYDEVIATNNNGRNVSDKIHNFENGDKYGVQFILNSDMVDLETNQKAHTTYKKYHA